MLALLRLIALGPLCIVASLLAILLGLLRPFHPDNTRIAALFFSVPARRLLGLRIEADMSALADLPPAGIVVANHQSNYDLFVWGCFLPPRTVTIGKKSLRWVPFFGQAYWLTGNVLIDRSNPKSALRDMQALSHTLAPLSKSLWVFAEGTRNRGQGLLPFKRGAFQIAVEAGVPVLPFCCSTYIRHLDFNRWHSGTILMRALPPLATTGMAGGDVSALAESCHARMKQCIAELDAKILECLPPGSSTSGSTANTRLPMA